LSRGQVVQNKEREIISTVEVYCAKEAEGVGLSVLIHKEAYKYLQ
jgi:hypothetical protein